MTDEELMDEVLAREELGRLREDTVTDIWYLFDGQVLKREDLMHLREGERIETK